MSFFLIILGVFVLGLIVYFVFRDKKETSHDAVSKKYSDILIVEELDRFFSKKKPYLNANYKISDLEKQLKVSRSAISAFTKERFGRNFNQFLNLFRISELQRLQSLLENEDKSINELCVKAGFNNAQQYYQAEKERKAINRSRNRNKVKNKYDTKKHDFDMLDDLDIIKKPDIKIRV